LQAYKNKGGKIYTIGSAKVLRDLADILTPSSLFQEIHTEANRGEFTKNLHQLAGESLITLKHAPYVIANIARKKGTDRIITHFVNYSDTKENIRVKLNLNGFTSTINEESISVLSPDSVPQKLKDIAVNGTSVEFTIPKLEIYNVVVIN
jgi:hypothetical protein